MGLVLLFYFSSFTTSVANKVTPTSVAYWNMDTAIKAEALGYEEQAFAFALEGLVNVLGEAPAVMYVRLVNLACYHRRLALSLGRAVPNGVMSGDA